MAEKKADEKDSAASFLRLYANLPLNERNQVVIVFEDEPISWEIARNEITHNTVKGKSMLKKLAELKII